MCACFVLVRRAGHDRLFAAKLRRVRRDRAPLQKLRPSDHLTGAIPAVAPQVPNMKLRGRQLAGRVFFVYNGAGIVVYFRFYIILF